MFTSGPSLEIPHFATPTQFQLNPAIEKFEVSRFCDDYWCFYSIEESVGNAP